MQCTSIEIERSTVHRIKFFVHYFDSEKSIGVGRAALRSSMETKVFTIHRAQLTIEATCPRCFLL